MAKFSNEQEEVRRIVVYISGSACRIGKINFLNEKGELMHSDTGGGVSTKCDIVIQPGERIIGFSAHRDENNSYLYNDLRFIIASLE